jgi:agmatine deiminase
MKGRSPQRARAAALFAAVLVLVALPGGVTQARSLAEELEGDDFLPVGLTEEELGNLDRIGERHRSTLPATGPVRNPGEFEPMTGVIVRYPWGNPTSLLSEYAEDLTLWVIVEDAADQSNASSDLSSAGCNMANVDWIFAPTNSIWTRDYGPWFLIDGNGDQGINDHVYNRPRPDDDVIPGVIGSDWSIPVYGMDIEHTGGNYMSDGRGTAMSTRLVSDENTDLTTADIDSMMNEYLGIQRYEKLPYIETGGIHHIDCWAKFLSPGKILVKQVASGHPSYDELEANVAYLSSLASSYGRPYEIVRVYAPNNEPYTNSIILNDKVYVPMWGSEWDDDAVATYEAAMPGYEILGFAGSWLTDDAIHCRAMGVTDRYMLYIDHVPLSDTPVSRQGYRVEADVIDHSDAGLVSDSLLVYWKTTGAPSFTAIQMTEETRGSYYAEIPTQSVGTEISYYIYAVDNSGRREAHPWVAPGDAHTFEVVSDTTEPAIVHEPLGDLTVPQWPPRIAAQVTDNTGVAEVYVQSWINGSPQTDVPMTWTGVGAEHEGWLPGSAEAGDVVEYVIVAGDAAAPQNTSSDPDTGRHSFDVLDAIDCVIWEPGVASSSGTVLAALLDSLDLSSEYTTELPVFGDYDAAFICLGIYSDNYSLGTAQANAVADYLDSGGNVYMEGGDCWAYDSTRTIYNPYFGVNGTQDGSGDLVTVVGMDATMCEGMNFAYSGPNSYIDHIEPIEGATKILKNGWDQAGCGVSNEGIGYRTVAASFEFGGLTDASAPSTKLELLARIIDFFGMNETGVVEQSGAVALRLAQNHPNPFNPHTRIAFELPVAGPVELSVYSAAGRRVATLVNRPLGAGPHEVSWSGVEDGGGRAASGVYFFRLVHNGDIVSRKGVLLK